MSPLNDFSTPLRRLSKLYIESARISLTEKLTRLLGGVAIALVCTLFIIICLAFVSIGVVAELKTVVPAVGAYMIVAGFYVLLIACLVIFKRTLLLNPIARFLSKIILENPISETCKHNEKENSHE